MTGKLTEEEIKNLEELIESDDIDCIKLANEIVKTLDENIRLKYSTAISIKILTLLCMRSKDDFIKLQNKKYPLRLRL